MSEIDEDFDCVMKSARVNVFNNESGNSYTVLLHDDEVHCDCKSYQFCIEPKTCKHIKYILNKLDNVSLSIEDENEELV